MMSMIHHEDVPSYGTHLCMAREPGGLPLAVSLVLLAPAVIYSFQLTGSPAGVCHNACRRGGPWRGVSGRRPFITRGNAREDLLDSSSEVDHKPGEGDRRDEEESPLVEYFARYCGIALCGFMRHCSLFIRYYCLCVKAYSMACGVELPYSVRRDFVEHELKHNTYDEYIRVYFRTKKADVPSLSCACTTHVAADFRVSE